MIAATPVGTSILGDQVSEKPSYLDENLSRDEKESGRTRQPMPADEGEGEEDGEGAGKSAEAPYPGDRNEDRSDKDFERPDEFGDGDRRS